MIINGILTEVQRYFKNKMHQSENKEEENKIFKELMEMHVHSWNLFFSLTDLSKGDLDAEI